MTSLNDNLQAFVATFESVFPGVALPAMPKRPEDLSMTVQMAIRENNPALWQNMFGGQGAPLPADIQHRLLNGEVYPEDAQALRAAHMDAYAAEADRQRESIIERSREATRAREQEAYQAQRARAKEFSSMGILGRMAASPLSANAIAQARAQWGITGE